MKGSFESVGIFLLVIVFLGALFLAGPLISDMFEDGTGADQLMKFSSEAELRSFLEENTGASGYYGPLSALGAPAVARTFGAQASDSMLNVEEAKSGGSGEAPSDYSTTNIQVEGVDEADIVKTDGEYVYAISKGTVYIIKAYTAEDAEIVSEIEKTGNPTEMYVRGDNLVVITSSYGGYYPLVKDIGVAEGMEEYEVVTEERRYSGPFSRILVYDVSDPSEPEMKRNVTMEGNYYDSRMIGDYVYAITEKSVGGFMEPGIPRMTFGTGSSEAMVPGSRDIYYFNVPSPSYQYTSLLSLNVEDSSEDPQSKTFLMSYGKNLYVSEDNIFITYRKSVDQKDLTDDIIKEVIIPSLPPQISMDVSRVWNSEKSYQERMQDVSEILNNYVESLDPEEGANFMEGFEEKLQAYYSKMSKEFERSQVHRIEIEDGEIEYRSGGSVPGYVLNQFSMDEEDGYFRVATTTSGWVGGMRGESMNHLYVLDPDLDVVGKLEDLAERESIYSVRFMGDRVYMVTFERVDPLFVIDLSDPENPEVLGKLKIPGYSNYLHPYDDDHLIGLGMETEENEYGRVVTTGIKLSLFDVSDVESPKEMSKYVLGGRGSSSYALRDHKAFLFDKDKELLVIPARVSDWDEGDEWRDVTYTDGAHVFTLNLEDGFGFEGEVTHQTEKAESEEDYYYPRYDESVKRSLYIEDVLYTLSESRMKINSLDDLDEIGEIVFGE